MGLVELCLQLLKFGILRCGCLLEPASCLRLCQRHRAVLIQLCELQSLV